MAARDDARARMVAILRVAYSAELAAFIAYHGHERSVRDPREKAEIRRIGREELHHRRVVRDLLVTLGGEPSARRERWMPWVGRLIWFACRIGGWFLPMYGAGRLEAGNVEPYVETARLALVAGLPEMVAPLVEMAEVEWDHEDYFHRKVRSHFLARVLPDWPDPAPRESIRAEFEPTEVRVEARAPALAGV